MEVECRVSRRRSQELYRITISNLSKMMDVLSQPELQCNVRKSVHQTQTNTADKSVVEHKQTIL